MAQDSAELRELKRHTRALASWEGSKGIFAGLVIGLFAGIMLAGMTADTSLLPITIYAPVVFPIVFAVIFYNTAIANVMGEPEKPAAIVPRPSRVPRPARAVLRDMAKSVVYLILITFFIFFTLAVLTHHV